jgi:hypothetical protein
MLIAKAKADESFDMLEYIWTDLAEKLIDGRPIAD